MRVVMIIQEYLPFVGGAERQLALIAPKLMASGIDVQIITRRQDDALPAYEVIDGVPVHRIARVGPKAYSSLNFTLNVQSIVGRLKPDIIHAHGLLSPTTAALISKRVYKVPVVAKILTGGDFGDIANLQSRPSGRLRLRHIKKSVDAFAVISREIGRELDQLSVPSSKQHWLPNGVDVDTYKPASKDEKKRIKTELGVTFDKIAVFCGRLTEQKGLDNLLIVWSGVRVKHPDAMLLIVGGGELETSLKAAAGAGVVFMGIRNDVDRLLKCADLFILPSESEGLSNAILEAMASEVCVVTTAVGGSVELIENGKTGSLVTRGHIAEMESVVLQLLNDDVLRTELGKNARKAILSEYALDLVVSRIRALYEGLCLRCKTS